MFLFQLPLLLFWVFILGSLGTYRCRHGICIWNEKADSNDVEEAAFPHTLSHLRSLEKGVLPSPYLVSLLELRLIVYLAYDYNAVYNLSVSLAGWSVQNSIYVNSFGLESWHFKPQVLMISYELRLTILNNGASTG